MRLPVVAGQFYPGTKNALLHDLETLMLLGKCKKDVIGIISPHAGYMFSGAVAGEVYSSIVPKSTYIILGPNHTGKGSRIASSKESWSTPLGEVAVDIELLDSIMNKTTLLVEDKIAHTFEHSVEVQLPFIQKISPEARIVPISIKSGSLQEYEDLAGALIATIKQESTQAMIVASTDMTHYESRKIAKYKDQKAIDEIFKIDGKGLIRVVEQQNISMCGYISTAVMLMVASGLGAKKAELLKYMDSGEVNGDINEVVGYAGVVIY